MPVLSPVCTSRDRGVLSAGRGAAHPPAPAVRTARRANGTAAAAVAMLAVCLLSACGSGGSGGSAAPSSPLGGHWLVKPLPQRTAGLRLDAMWPSATREELLSNRPSVGGAPVYDTVDARYEETKKAKGRKWTRLLTFTGYDARVVTDQWQPTVDDILGTFQAVGTPGEDFEIPTGPFGGYARCTETLLLDSASGMCAWADDGTVGIVYGPNFNAAELRDLLPPFRADVER
ncbi:hypothetical protein ACFPKZ_31740 [Streptosporangium amethystogenes subsp. fukuiense]|uniref:hypothetical protein n=1 Tax=Streptosporangium amethystogenes TaxID=2002 RepID=UPI0031DEDB44